MAETKAGDAKSPKNEETKKQPPAPKAEKGAKGVEVTAVRNISLRQIAKLRDIPPHLLRHPGGARVEKGAKIVVDAATADYLRTIGYAK